MRRTLFLVTAILLLAPTANAGGGVLEINQACAENTGCFSGDDPGWPVNIDTPGSYVLTSNLVVPEGNTHGVLVKSPSVSIDLRGFEISTQACLNATADCTPEPGFGRGIWASSGDRFGIAVKNGGISGMRGGGIGLLQQAEVTNLRVRWNAGNGISVGEGSTVSGNVAYQNGEDGIVSGAGSAILENVVYENGAQGIYCSWGAIVTGNTVYANTDQGIFCGLGSTIAKNTVYLNSSEGIFAHAGSNVSGNTMRNNSGWGLKFLSSDSGYSGNVISGNTAGSVSSGSEFGTNLCNGNTTCP